MKLHANDEMTPAKAAAELIDLSVCQILTNHARRIGTDGPGLGNRVSSSCSPTLFCSICTTIMG